jgi:hypothetical protein
MVIVGIDPGFSGAWGMIRHDGQYVACGDMLNNKSHILSVDVFREIAQARDGDDMELVIEQVASRPGQGVASTFKFGMAYGAAIAVAERFLVPWRLVTPMKWKKGLGLSSDKAESLGMARSLWPDAPLKRIKDGGRAEALLIAEWYRLTSLSS